MLSSIEKRKIVERLNSLFDSYDAMRAFCERLNNDHTEVKRMISKAIKYGFVKSDFVFENQSLFAVLHRLDKIDNEYEQFKKENPKGLFYNLLNKRKSKKELLEESKRLKKCGYELDQDIDIEDIFGIELPQDTFIESICRENVERKAYERKKSSARAEFYRIQRGFDETAFTYSRVDELKLDQDSFVYYNSELTGQLYEDYRFIYSSERYTDNNFKNSPLNRSFEENLAEIRRKNDIQLRKKGNVYEIENGRHRILYLLRSSESVTIPVHITRRIEDREFNITLNELKNKYGVSVYKNNLLDDESNVLIEYQGTAYEINGTDSMKLFLDNLNNGKSNDGFNFFDFNIDDSLNKKETLKKYKTMLFERYKTDGDSVFLGNFTDIVNSYGDVNNRYFYEAYVLMQSEFQTAKVYKYNFEDYAKHSIGIRDKKDIGIHPEEDYDAK